jgi:hypothetical protein
MRFLNNPILQVGFTGHNIFLNVLNVIEALIINLGPSMLMDENFRDSKLYYMFNLLKVGQCTR